MRAQSLINRLLALMTAIGHYVNKETAIVTALYHNKLPAGILSDDILTELYRNISSMVQTHSGFGSFYALHLLADVAVSTTDDALFVYVKIPLPGPNEYTVRQIYRMPQRTENGHSIILDLDHDFVAEGRNTSMLLTRDQLAKCHTVDVKSNKMYVCRAHGTWVSSHADNCIVKLLHSAESTPKICHRRVMKQSLEMFLAMHHMNLWLFAFAAPKEFQVECGASTVTAMTLNASGILHLRRNCNIYTDDISLPFFGKGHSNVDFRMPDQLPNNRNRPNGQLNLPADKPGQFMGQRLVVTDFNQLQRIINDRMKDIHELQRETHNSRALHRGQLDHVGNMQNWQYATLATSIVSLSLSIVLIAALGFVLYYRKCKRLVRSSNAANASSAILPSTTEQNRLKSESALNLLKTIKIYVEPQSDAM